jgi:hypothetical protein
LRRFSAVLFISFSIAFLNLFGSIRVSGHFLLLSGVRG